MTKNNLITLRFIYAVCALSINLSCGKNLSTDVTPADSKVSGGIDGSGGDTLQSTYEEIQIASLALFNNFQFKIKNIENKLSLGEDQFDQIYETGSFLLISDFLKIQNNQSELLAALSNKKIILFSIYMEDFGKPGFSGGCFDGSYTNAGNAKGNLNGGIICYLLNKFHNIPPYALEREMFSLTAHELSHLSGFNEPRAVELQKLISKYPDLTL